MGFPRQRGRFNSEQDLLVLREAVSIRVYQHDHGLGWKLMLPRLKPTGCFWPTLSTRSLRERVALLLEHYEKKKLNPDFDKEEKTEKDELLEQLSEMRRLFWEGSNMEENEELEYTNSVMVMNELLTNKAPVVTTAKVSPQAANRARSDMPQDDCDSDSSYSSWDEESRGATEHNNNPSTPAFAQQGQSGSVSGMSHQQNSGDGAQSGDTFERRGTKRVASEFPKDVLKFLKKQEKRRARERREELQIRREELQLRKDELELQRKERTAFLNLIAKLLMPKANE